MSDTAAHEAVRPATQDDVVDLVALAGAAIAEKGEQKGGAIWRRREGRQQPLDADLAQAIDDPDHAVVVGLLHGVPMGYGVAHVEVLADGGRLGVVDDLYVDPGAREVGLGEALMDDLVAWCRAQGCFGVDSLALPGDRLTKNFFESFGLVARAIVVHRSLTD